MAPRPARKTVGSASAGMSGTLSTQPLRINKVIARIRILHASDESSLTEMTPLPQILLAAIQAAFLEARQCRLPETKLLGNLFHLSLAAVAIGIGTHLRINENCLQFAANGT